MMLLLLLAGCAVEQQIRLPEMLGTKVDEQKIAACAAIFPEGKWQFVHSIEFTMKDGAGPPLIGVTTVDGSDIGCALITVEGLTLFEAVYQDKKSVVVRRALPPFDKPEFARGLIDDIRAIFQPPKAEVLTGQLVGAKAICRYKERSGGIVDIEVTADDCWQRKEYSPQSLLQRSITGRSCRKNGPGLIPEYLELKTYGQSGYILQMTLIRADTIP